MNSVVVLQFVVVFYAGSDEWHGRAKPYGQQSIAFYHSLPWQISREIPPLADKLCGDIFNVINYKESRNDLLHFLLHPVYLVVHCPKA